MLGKESLLAQGLEHSLVACALDPPQDGLTMRGDSCGCSCYLNVRLSRDLAHLQNPKYLGLMNPHRRASLICPLLYTGRELSGFLLLPFIVAYELQFFLYENTVSQYTHLYQK